jgi:general secretion pathway protein G
MNKTLRHAAAKGFTLIELLIVVIIIAILAAIAIPQFANTTGDAQEGAVSANLNTIRSALELYRVQHNGKYPSAMSSVPTGAAATACTGTKGSGTADNTQAFVDQLTMFSNAAGETCSIAAAGFSFGPYLREIPSEALSGVASNTVTIKTDTTYTAPTTEGSGWLFFNNDRVGKFVVNSSKVGRRGTALSTY